MSRKFNYCICWSVLKEGLCTFLRPRLVYLFIFHNNQVKQFHISGSAGIYCTLCSHGAAAALPNPNWSGSFTIVQMVASPVLIVFLLKAVKQLGIGLLVDAKLNLMCHSWKHSSSGNKDFKNKGSKMQKREPFFNIDK